MRKYFKTTILIVIILTLVGTFVVQGMLSNNDPKDEKPTPVRVEAVKLGELVEIITAPGQIEPKSKVEISAKVAARIVELPFEEGQEVKKGDLLIKLDSKDLESGLRSAQASYEAQKAQIEVDKANIERQKASLQANEATLRQAQLDFERQKQLLESKDISQATFDQIVCRLEEQQGQNQAAKQGLKAAELGLVVMEHNLQASKERIEQAKESLSYATITSPMDGIVTRINAEVGEMVMTGTMNNAGTIIMQVADLSQMLLVAQVDESDIGKVAEKQKAKIRVQAFWGHEFEGVVDKIALTQDRSSSGTNYYKTEIIIAADDEHQLFSGLTADVDIETCKHENVLKIPTQAVVSMKVDDLPLEIRQDNPNVDLNKTDALVVYRMIDGKAVATPVTIGESDMTHIIIKSGLSEGDLVVVGPYKVLGNIKPDQKIIDETEEKKEEEKHQDRNEENDDEEVDQEVKSE
ncbi:MAG: efflux RND transporter periplasmic adaptor subunit [Planctomycetes bacterium]|nr:efflux RND transporter periplasmic adaptor subunit [Planctomycetota bacterium]